MNEMLLKLDKEINWIDEWICAQIHDSITIAVPVLRGEYWLRRLPEIMYYRLPTNGIELISDAKCSKEWIEVK